MTTTVTVSEFRENLSEYLEFLTKKGAKVEITDGRKGKTIIKLIKVDEPEFDWVKHLEWVKNMKPFITDKDLKSMGKFREDINRRFVQAKNR